jgi:SET domain-containing protein
MREGPALSLVKVPEIPGGYGVKACVNIKAGAFVGEYVGDVISNQDMRVRQAVSLMEGETCFYTMHLAGSGQHAVHIDAREKGNLTRFINHCEMSANLVCLKWDVAGMAHCIFIGTRDILAHEELRYNYGSRGKGLIPYFI